MVHSGFKRREHTENKAQGRISLQDFSDQSLRSPGQFSGKSHRPLTPILVKSIAIHLPFLSRDFCTSMPSSWQRVVYTTPMYITIRLAFVLRCSCRSIGVRGHWNTPQIFLILPREERLRTKVYMVLEGCMCISSMCFFSLLSVWPCNSPSWWARLHKWEHQALAIRNARF